MKRTIAKRTLKPESTDSKDILHVCIDTNEQKKMKRMENKQIKYVQVGK